MLAFYGKLNVSSKSQPKQQFDAESEKVQNIVSG